MIEDKLITLGGKVFYGVSSVAYEYGVSPIYVQHMLDSDDYPGCRLLTEDEKTRYLQTLTLIKVRDDVKWISSLNLC